MTKLEVMTKQEVIREAIDIYTDDGCLYPDRSCNALGSGYCSSMEESYKCLMERLTKIGVVIKVEMELPMPSCSGTEDFRNAYRAGGERILDDIEKAGYTAIEPLIEEKSSEREETSK